MIIKLVRHGLSKSNVKEVDVTQTGDYRVELTPTGKRQASLAGDHILRNNPLFFNERTLIYCSPYIRTRETLRCILNKLTCQPKVYEDPRLREIEWGYDQQEDFDIDFMRETHGKFYFRVKGGESPADGYDRISGFISTMMRQIRRKEAKKVLIVTHGLTIRCFVMRFMHLTVEQFDEIINPKHCDIITITNESHTITPQFTTGMWQLCGLRLPGSPGPASWPWYCSSCDKYEVWPNMSNRTARCESCGTVGNY